MLCWLLGHAWTGHGWLRSCRRCHHSYFVAHDGGPQLVRRVEAIRYLLRRKGTTTE